MDLKERLQTVSKALKGLSAKNVNNYLIAATVKRHNWTPEEINAILDQYKAWGKNAGQTKEFRLKDFVLSLRNLLPFLSELTDEQFYSRVKRVLYRALVKYNIRWQHAGKKPLKDQSGLPPALVKLLNELEDNGIGIADDGSVLITFTMSPITGEEDGYELYDVVGAIAHLKKVAQNKSKEFVEIAPQAATVVELLKQFLEQWKVLGKESKLYKPPVHKTLDQSEYKITQNPVNQNLVSVQKQDGTVYQVDRLNHTCTCPAGQEGRPCKHLRAVQYEH